MNGEPPPSQRHFIALRLDEVAARRVAAVDAPVGARRVPQEDLHVTLAFLGTLDARGEANAGAAMAEAAQNLPPPRVRLDQLEFWRETLVLCAAPASSPDATGVLAARLNDALARREMRVDGLPFRTHVTIARLHRREALPPRPLRSPVAWAADEIVLLASRAGAPAVPRYHVVHRIAFAGAAFRVEYSR